MRRYLKYCTIYKIPNCDALPAKESVLCKYVAYLIKDGVSIQSVPAYLQGVRHLHKRNNVPWTGRKKSYFLHEVIVGAERLLGVKIKQKEHVTPKVLRAIKSQLNLNDENDLMFWGACLLAFFTFFRKSNVVAKTADKFDPEVNLCKGDIEKDAEGVTVTARWTKTIQFQERVLQVPINQAPGSDLDFLPVWEQIKGLGLRGPKAPAFQTKVNGKWRPMTHLDFTKKLKAKLAAAGLPSAT
eukprot:TRINITY_DN14105_c0_g1_i1.p1 TRINITY_DN14105_c0_g1~~TRINITY_DN14105_c0_g1_i1.p1  ORF type:complete len:241 (+),score=47.59 TRINITY_DN14105_c0_g1_i1:243-965(+)